MKINKGFMITSFLILLIIPFGLADRELVSETNNLIKISSWKWAECQGTICSYEFVIENLDSVNRQAFIGNIFDKNIDVRSFERFGEIEKTRTISNPYVCGSYEDFLNGSLTNISVYCDNETIENYIEMGWETIPVNKYGSEFKTSSAQSILLHKLSENTFRVKVYQPLGVFTKFDIFTENWDDSVTILDPWIDTNTYILNLSSVIPLVPQNSITSYMSAETDAVDDLGVTTYSSSYREIEKGVLFNGVRLQSDYEDHIDTNHFINGVGSFSMWVKFNQTLEYGVTAKQLSLWSEGYSACHWSSASKHFQCGIGNSGGISQWAIYTGDFVADTWYNIILTWDGSSRRLYINGDSIVNTSGQSQSDYTSGVILGASFSTTTENINVTIDEYVYYNNHVFNQTEIQDLYNRRLKNLYNKPYENISISNNQTGVHILMSGAVLGLNDTALGTQLENNTCYDLGESTSLNWSISLNTSVSDWSNLVNYTFTTCPAETSTSTVSGGGDILSAITNDVENFMTIFEALEQLMNDFNGENVNQVFVAVDNELAKIFSSPVSVSDVNSDVYVYSGDVKKDNLEAYNRMIEDPSGTNLWIYIKTIIQGFFSNSNLQITGDLK